MPIIVILGILAAFGVAEHAGRDRGKTYHHNDMENLLREMTGKSKVEKRSIVKRYGRR